MMQKKQVQFEESIQVFDIPWDIHEVDLEALFYRPHEFRQFKEESEQEQAQALQKRKEEKRAIKEAKKRQRRKRIQARREARQVKRTLSNSKANRRTRIHRTVSKEVTQ